VSLQKKRPLSICFVPLPSFTLSPFALLIDALRLAADEGDRGARIRCQWTVMGPDLQPIRASCGTYMTPGDVFSDPRRFDYIAVCGGLRGAETRLDRRTHAFMHRAANAGVSLIGLCTGVFALAHAGLMTGRRCCVSWFHRREMAEEYPSVIPVAHQLFIVDGNRITCAGGLGAGDLAAWLVKKHCGVAVAQKCLHLLQMDVARKPETPQPQPPGWRPTSNIHVRQALLLMEENLSEPISINRIARALNISVRQLERRFKEHIGHSPQHASTIMRLRIGRWLLGNPKLSITDIAQETGFTDLASFSRRFLREFGLRPSKLREQGCEIGTELDGLGMRLR
jgi:transcriptional regulator GlxA family with amidase domain